MPADEIEFLVEEAAEGGFIARSLGDCIFTEAETLDELYANVRAATCCHCDECRRPRAIRLRFVKTVREEVIELEAAP